MDQILDCVRMKYRELDIDFMSLTQQTDSNNDIYDCGGNCSGTCAGTCQDHCGDCGDSCGNNCVGGFESVLGH